MRIFTAFTLMICLIACQDDKSDEQIDKDKTDKPVTQTPEMDFCDCGLLAIEKAKVIDSDPDQLEKYDEEFKPCKVLFDSIDVKARIQKLMECPEVLENMEGLEEHIDVGGFLERARMKSDEVDADLKELEEMGSDTTINKAE